jgi:hypothetical protein
LILIKTSRSVKGGIKRELYSVLIDSHENEKRKEEDERLEESIRIDLPNISTFKDITQTSCDQIHHDE